MHRDDLRECLHRRDGGGRAGLSGQVGERHQVARCFDIVERLASGKMRGVDLLRRDGDDFRAVDEFSRILAKNSHLCHSVLEALYHEVVVR